MIKDSLGKHLVPTVPDDTTDPPRFGQPIETTKDVFVTELRKFFNRQGQTVSKVEELPTIRKFDMSVKNTESSQETAVTLIQKFPQIDEHLPLVAVLAATGRNYPMSMGLGGSHIGQVMDPVTITGTVAEPYSLLANQTITFKTTTCFGDVRNTTITLRSSRFADITAATADEVIQEINKQALYATGWVATVNEDNYVAITYNDRKNIKGDIEITGGTAIAALGFTIGQSALYRNSTPYNRYIQSTSIDVAIEVVAEDYNTRTELQDLVWAFFTSTMNERDYTFLGRSVFDSAIKNESYQIVLKPDPSMSGEQEVPRPGDEKDKLYVNRINISVTTMQYLDKAVLVPGTNTPMYLSDVTVDETIPQKN
jgi:hypothetical protein